MAEISEIIARAVAQVLDNQLPRLRDELTQKVLEAVRPEISASGGPSDANASDLLKALSLIQAGSTQKEILRALLDSTGHYSGRSALFVIKGGSASGWQGRAFDNNEDIKEFALDVKNGMPAEALHTRATVSAKISEMDAKFVSQFGAPVEDKILLLPLRLKDKVAALVYADAGTEAGGKLDVAALELLVSATSAWLEVASLRKQAAKDGASEDAAPTPVQNGPAFSDPFAGHAPIHAVSAPDPSEQSAMASPEVVVASAGGSAVAAAPAADVFANMSVEDADVHRKAQRFARLLIDEVKLYNQAKVAEGRKNKDLYDRLKEDIDKSRGTYMKRYGNTVAAGADYLNAEVVRSLAEDDASLLGPNFKR